MEVGVGVGRVPAESPQVPALHGRPLPIAEKGPLRLGVLGTACKGSWRRLPLGLFLGISIFPPTPLLPPLSSHPPF